MKPDESANTVVLSAEDLDRIKTAQELDQNYDDDWHRWLTENFTIKDKAGKVRLMSPLKQSQLKLLKLYEWCREQNQPVRIIVLKARKTGISTLIEALMFLEVLSAGKDAIVIAHDKPTAEYIFGITSRFYDNYPLQKPNKAQSSVRKMSFKNQEGMITVETANNVSAGRGTSPQILHCSECAFWHKGSDTAVSLFQSIGEQSETVCVLESTANGFDSLFQPTWENADKYCQIKWKTDDEGEIQPEIEINDPDYKWNGYLPYFISWFDDPEYTKEFRDIEEKDRFAQTLDEREQHLKEYYQVNLEQLNWYRCTLREKCQGDVKIRRQEYPSTPQEAFVSSGRPYIDHDALGLMPLEEGRRGLLIQDDHWSKEVRFIRDKNEMLTIFKDPQRGHRYVMGIDCAEGILPEGSKDPDQSVCVILDMDDGARQVAVLAGYIGEEELAQRVILLAQHYNDCFCVPEVSGYGQHICIYLGQNYPHHLLYHRTDFLRDRPKRSRQIGWRTTMSSRPILLGDLKQAISDQAVIIHAKDTLEQLKRLEYNARGRIEAGTGAHDDHCFALGLAIQGIKSYPNHVSIMKSKANQLKPFGERQEDDSIDPITGY